MGVNRTPQGDLNHQYSVVREAVGLCDFSFTTRYKVPEEGLDLLEKYAAGPVANIRFGRVLHTFAADEEGLLESDLFVANDDEHLIVIGENLNKADQVAATLDKLGGKEAGLENVTEDTVLYSIDGFKAYAVVKDLFGPDVLGLPYLSIETYDLDGAEIKLIRAGKTAEFGYLLMAQKADGDAVWQKIVEAGQPHGLEVVGFDVHQMLRLDGRFFNIFKEGNAVRDPLSLGLQWMIDMDSEEFQGCEPVMSRREAGLSKKIIGLVAMDKGELAEGDKVMMGDKSVATLVNAAFSPTLGLNMGLALFDIDVAYSGLELMSDKGAQIETISLPPFIPKSLTVKLDEM